MSGYGKPKIHVHVGIKAICSRVNFEKDMHNVVQIGINKSVSEKHNDLFYFNFL